MKTNKLVVPRSIQQYFVGAIGLSVLLFIITTVNTYISYAPAHIHGFWVYITPIAMNAALPLVTLIALFLSRTKRTFNLATVFAVLLVELTIITLVTAVMTISMLTTQIVYGGTFGYQVLGDFIPWLIVITATAIIIYRLRATKQW